MDVNFVASGIQEEEEAFGVDENYHNDNPIAEGENETCGICMDTIIDRGVLDCCHHWFCFACIENWATITNLCPLCQNEFQVITCVPVYDAVGSKKLDDGSSERDDDWSIEGTNNTVSFPSYYIDENSVICLDGDGCKVRSGSAKIEEDSNLDTSIACDSCDLWYHAFCVGFDPESTSENTWLCPRCVAGEMRQKSDAGSVKRSNDQCDLGSRESLTEDTFSRKVSVSSVDTGDTAVVVSMVGDSGHSNLPTLEVGKDFESESLVSASEDCHKLEQLIGMKSIKLEAQELELSLSCDTSFSLPSNASEYKHVGSSTGEAVNELKHFDGVNSSSGKPNESHSKRLSDSQCSMGLNLGLCAGPFLSVDTNSTGIEHDDTKDVKPHDPLEHYLPKVDRIVGDASSEAPDMTGAKRKHTDCSGGVSDDDDRGTHPKNKNKVAGKRIRDGEKIQQIASKDLAKTQVSDSGNGSSLTVVPKDSELKCHPVLSPTSEILSIVRTTNRKSSKGLAGPNSGIQSSEEQDSMASLRVKKIMRRDAEDKGSSVVVQRLRKEIREAVRTKSSKDIGENQFDPKLLDAFREALAGTKTEPVKKLSDSALKVTKSMLEKGKVRENLTKKIYGTSNGRRKRAWDRDCQIEFWKHRCIGEPEKIETLKSVLGLLNGSSQKLNIKHESDTLESTSPILSRLYLADTSVFPRKDNIKPLLAPKAAGYSEQNDKEVTATESCSKPSLDHRTSTSTEMNKVSVKVGIPLSETNGNRKDPPSSDTGAAKVHQDRHSGGSVVSSSGSIKLKTKKDIVAKTGDIKVDKRKWALEVLARKMSGTGKNTTNEKQEDNSGLKGNYPLLAQLPADMKPALSSCRHNKIPTSVRQTQLYRMTEHLLQKANLPVICRTADTELAVADAINIEKEIADKSSSKLVYMNLCCQEILQLSQGNKASGTPVISSSPSSRRADRSGEPVLEPSTNPVTEEALRNAGLLSDSPPNSPHSNMETPAKEDDPSLNIKEEGPDNVFEMDVNPNLDIYGDFEYNLEDEDYIGATATKVSNMQPEGGASKIKVVFSTLQPEISNHTIDLGSTEKVVQVHKDSSCMLENDTFSGLENSTRECETDKSCVPLESIFGKEGEELSAAECEELYGPDIEPLIKKFPGASEILYGSIDAGLVKDNYLKETESCGPKPTGEITSPSGNENQGTYMSVASVGCNSSGAEDSTNHPQPDGSGEGNKKSSTESKHQSNNINSIFKKVEAYIKEHIRPLCKSGVITTEQYKWAVAKTAEKVMKYHSKAKSASFLIKEGEKVKKLAEQYVETSQKEKGDSL